MRRLAIIILTPILVLLVVIAAFSYISSIHNNKVQYCENWLSHINDAKVQLQNTLFPSDSDRAELNNQIDQYNKECAY